MKKIYFLISVLFCSGVIFGSGNVYSSLDLDSLNYSSFESIQQYETSLNTEYKVCEENSSIDDSEFDSGFNASIRCGIAPIPPIGCEVGNCVCDSYGNNCSWTFNCN